MPPKAAVRDKTRNSCALHFDVYKPDMEQLLLGDSHTERLTWRFPNIAPQNTWLCGVGGDRISQLLWRVSNDEQLGYSQNSVIANSAFERIGILIGSNTILNKKMTEKQISAMITKVSSIAETVKHRWPNAAVVVFPIPPIPLRGRQERDQDSVDAYNAALVAAGLTLESVEWPEMDLVNDFEDEVHLSAYGYQKWWTMLRSAGFV